MSIEELNIRYKMAMDALDEVLACPTADDKEVERLSNLLLSIEIDMEYAIA